MILLRNSLLAARGIAACSRVVSRPLSQQQTKAPSKPGFIRRNIQQIANIVIVYITVSYAAYNYKVHISSITNRMENILNSFHGLFL